LSNTATAKVPSVYNKGYSATREEAMADFKIAMIASY